MPRVIRKTQGAGRANRAKFDQLGDGVVIEDGVRAFHPENIFIGDDVYIGHDTILKGYHKNKMKIGAGTWIGQQCFFHAAGGIEIGENVGIGPGVKILTSQHELGDKKKPILHSPLKFARVTIESDADIGAGTVILPGVRVGRGSQIGAGAVVAKDVPAYAVAAGNPARVLRRR